MKKKIIPILIILLVLIIGTGAIYFISSKSNLKETKKEEVIKTSEKTKENITAKTEKIDEEKKEDKKDEKDKTVTPKEEKQESSKKSSESQSKNNNTEPKQNNVEQTPVVQEPAPQNNVVVEQPQEPVKKSGPWEAWGMTEDQYYNQPMHSWERVDFSSMNECLNYGDNYSPYLNGEVLYNCREITSASGKFLGVMFDTEKLN